MEKATFAAGCFWGVEEVFGCVKGVVSTSVGYTDGTLENPTYEQVCTDKTGHAEAVELLYDPSEVSYEELLKVFWGNHDRTSLNRQGPDIGTQSIDLQFSIMTKHRRLLQKLQKRDFRDLVVLPDRS